MNVREVQRRFWMIFVLSAQLFLQVCLDCKLMFLSLTRSLTKIHDKLTEKIQQQPYWVQCLWNWGVEAKKWRMENGRDNSHWFYDPVIFSKVCVLSALNTDSQTSWAGECACHY